VSPENERQPVPLGLALGSVVFQVGCVTLVLTLAAVLAGRGLDNLLGTGALFTLLLFLFSVPVVWYLIWRIARSAAARLNPPSEDLPSKEE
jgi:hypothetical protein